LLLFFKKKNYKKKIDGLSTIAWVSNLVRPKLTSSLRRLGQKNYHVGIFESDGPLDFGL
jgi:hypothetical protein